MRLDDVLLDKRLREYAVAAERIAAAAERIADALKSLAADQARCGHGATGLCMSCVIQNDLLRP